MFQITKKPATIQTALREANEMAERATGLSLEERAFLDGARFALEWLEGERVTRPAKFIILCRQKGVPYSGKDFQKSIKDGAS